MILLLSTIPLHAYKVVRPSYYLQYNKIRNLYYEIHELKDDPNRDSYNLEHVVPQSLFKKNSSLIKKDMHNIILYPEKLNLHRSNYKFTPNPNIFPTSKLLDEMGKEKVYQTKLVNDYGIKTSKFRMFHPPDKFKGIIARSSMYFISAYPEFKDDILERIIDPYTLLNWHCQHPVSKFEVKKNLEIFKIQQNSNIYITNPEVLVINMEEILGESLDIFKDYEFNFYLKKIDF